MELHNLALAKAAAAERQMLQRQHHHRPSPAVLPAFYPPLSIPAGGQNHSVAPSSFAVTPDRRGPAVLPAQSASLPVYRSVLPASSDFSLQNAATTLKSRENPSSDETGGRISVPDSKARLTLTGSRSTTAVKRHVNSFSIDSLLGRQDRDEDLDTLEVRKSVAGRVVVDTEAMQGGVRPPTLPHRPAAGHEPVSPICFARAPVFHVVPGCTARPELVTWF